MQREKRGMIFGAYDTTADDWTLTGWSLSSPEQKTSYIDIPGGDGAVDQSTALTDGIPRYHNRTLTATFELSTGDRTSRGEILDKVVNSLDGHHLQITLPDKRDHYIEGRVHVAVDFHDRAHCGITVTATVLPWKFKKAETAVSLSAVVAEQTATLTNSGRRVMTPTIVVEGNVRLAFGTASASFTSGAYQWPELCLTPGEHQLTYSGAGTLTLSYREAVLQ